MTTPAQVNSEIETWWSNYVNKNSDNKDMNPALPSDKPAHNLQDHP